MSFSKAHNSVSVALLKPCNPNVPKFPIFQSTASLYTRIKLKLPLFLQLNYKTFLCMKHSGVLTGHEVYLPKFYLNHNDHLFTTSHLAPVYLH